MIKDIVVYRIALHRKFAIIIKYQAAIHIDYTTRMLGITIIAMPWFYLVQEYPSSALAMETPVESCTKYGKPKAHIMDIHNEIMDIHS